jgi:hypothetical protein
VSIKTFSWFPSEYSDRLLVDEDEAQLAFLHVVDQPPAGMVDLEAVTASFERRPGVRSVYGKLGMATHLAITTAQIAAYAVCPVLNRT